MKLEDIAIQIDVVINELEEVANLLTYLNCFKYDSDIEYIDNFCHKMNGLINRLIQ